jgi:hypothetical protein
VLRRTRSQPQPQLRTPATTIHDMPEGQRRLVRAGLEALRDPEMERRVRAHLEERGDSPRDLISAALVAARFHRGQSAPDRNPQAPNGGQSVSQST